MKLSEVISAAIEIGRRNGFVTFDQLDELIVVRGKKALEHLALVGGIDRDRANRLLLRVRGEAHADIRARFDADRQSALLERMLLEIATSR